MGKNTEPHDSAQDLLVDERQHPFTIIYNIIIERYLPVIGADAFAVYSVLCKMAGAKGKAWPTIETITRACLISERQVHYCIKHLIAVGLIRSTRRPNRPNLYAILDIDPNVTEDQITALLYEEQEADPKDDPKKRRGIQCTPGGARSAPRKRTNEKEEDSSFSSASLQKKNCAPELETAEIATSFLQANSETVPTEQDCSRDIETTLRPITNDIKPKKPRARDVIWDAFEELTRINSKLYSASRFAKELKPFKEIGVTVEQVSRFREWWYRNDWRGVKGQPPTMQNCRELWGVAVLIDAPEYPTEPKVPRKPASVLRMEQQWKEMDDERNS